MNKGEFLPRNKKNFKDFKIPKEVKLLRTRMLVKLEQNGGLNKIVAILMQCDLEDIAPIFKNKYR